MCINKKNKKHQAPELQVMSLRTADDSPAVKQCARPGDGRWEMSVALGTRMTYRRDGTAGLCWIRPAPACRD